MLTLLQRELARVVDVAQNVGIGGGGRPEERGEQVTQALVDHVREAQEGQEEEELEVDAHVPRDGVALFEWVGGVRGM